MCDPMTIGSLAVSAIGAKMNADAQARSEASVINARNDAYAANNVVQQGLQKQATTQLNDTLNKFTPANQATTLDNAQQNRVNAGVQAVATAPTIMPDVSPSAPQIVRDAYTKAGANAAIKAQQTATAEGVLGGYGDTNLENNLNINTGQNNLQPIVESGQHNASLLPIEMESAANNAYKPPNPTGQILEAAGGLGAAYAGGGGTFASLGNSASNGVSRVLTGTAGANTGGGLYSTLGNAVKGAQGYYGPGF